MHRRTLVALLAGSALSGAARLAADQPVEIRISAKKFEFHPNKVTARVGQSVILVLTSEYRIRGFKMVANGELDHIPEQAFFMAGGIEDVVENAEKMKKES